MSHSEINEGHIDGEISTPGASNEEPFSQYTEILTEFLSSIMVKDYDRALYYCSKILGLDPNNATAQEFYPLIIEKLEIQLEDSSSESSVTYSSSSSRSSENSTIFNMANAGSNYAYKTRIRNENYEKKIVESVNGLKNNNFITSKTKLMTRNSETIRPSNSLHPKIHTRLEAVTLGESQIKKSGNKTLMHSKLVTERKQTAPVKGKNILDKETKIITKSKEKPKLQDWLGNSGKQQTSKVLLHPTKTKIISKKPHH